MTSRRWEGNRGLRAAVVGVTPRRVSVAERVRATADEELVLRLR